MYFMCLYVLLADVNMAVNRQYFKIWYCNSFVRKEMHSAFVRPQVNANMFVFKTTLQDSK